MLFGLSGFRLAMVAVILAGSIVCLISARQIRQQTEQLAKGLNVVGLMNVQFAIQAGELYLLEVNPRASRTVPFVSKCIGLSLAQIGARCMLGQSLASQCVTFPLSTKNPGMIAVKESVFPFIKFLIKCS